MSWGVVEDGYGWSLERTAGLCRIIGFKSDDWSCNK